MGSSKKKKASKKPDIKYPRLIVSAKRHKQLAAAAAKITRETGKRTTIATVVEDLLAASIDGK